MKTFFVYILFFVFAIRPIYNIGYVAYYGLNIDYIVETYCVNKEKPKLQCNGKCHLAKQITINTSENNKTPSVNTDLYQSFFPVFFKAYEPVSLFVFEQSPIEKNNYYFNKKRDLYKDLIDPPPEYLM